MSDDRADHLIRRISRDATTSVVLGALVLVSVALLVGFFAFFGSESQPGQPQPRQGPPGTGPLTVVAMGDSTASGEGAYQYTPTTNGQGGDWCHRSPNAFVEKIAVPGITAHVNLACSGAPAEQVALGGVKQWTEGSQAQQLAALVKDHRVAAVVIAVGANDDPKFSNQVTDCFKAWFDPGGPPCSTALKQSWQSKVDAMVPKVAAAVSDVKKVLAQAGYVPADYQLILQSYAAPIGPDVPEDLRSLNGCPFRVEDLRWISQTGIGVLSSGIKTAARQTGARFLDLAKAACAARSVQRRRQPRDGMVHPPDTAARRPRPSRPGGPRTAGVVPPQRRLPHRDRQLPHGVHGHPRGQRLLPRGRGRQAPRDPGGRRPLTFPALEQG